MIDSTDRQSTADPHQPACPAWCVDDSGPHAGHFSSAGIVRLNGEDPATLMVVLARDDDTKPGPPYVELSEDEQVVARLDTVAAVELAQLLLSAAATADTFR